MFYASHLCLNCKRDKRVVARAVCGPDYDLTSKTEWKLQRWCYECVDARCQDFSDDDNGEQWQCPEKQAVQEPGRHPAVYLHHCTKHHRERTECSRSHCHNLKEEPWAPFCASCQAKEDGRQERDRLARWRQINALCPDCRKTPVHAPQLWCKACLRKRGLTPLAPLPSVRAVLREAWVRRIGEPLDPCVGDQHEARYDVERKKLRRKEYDARWKERRAAAERQNVNGLVNAVSSRCFSPNPEERAAAGIRPSVMVTGVR